jgi:hypothetical protein
MNEASKLATLVENEGYDSAEEFLEARGLDNVVPGICMNEGCDYCCDYEPDQDAGWCEFCDTQTVKSGLMLAGYM